MIFSRLYWKHGNFSVMICLWFRTFFQPWTVEEFSSIFCVQIRHLSLTQTYIHNSNYFHVQANSTPVMLYASHLKPSAIYRFAKNWQFTILPYTTTQWRYYFPVMDRVNCELVLQIIHMDFNSMLPKLAPQLLIKKNLVVNRFGTS